MIAGVGTDLVHAGQLPACVLQPGDPFYEHTFTQAEREIAASRTDPIAFLRGRFAGKEAVFKALRANPDELKRWDAIEILSDANGAPVAHLHRAMAQRAHELGVCALHLSLSNDDGDYLAFCVAECR